MDQSARIPASLVKIDDFMTKDNTSMEKRRFRSHHLLFIVATTIFPVVIFQSIPTTNSIFSTRHL